VPKTLRRAVVAKGRDRDARAVVSEQEFQDLLRGVVVMTKSCGVLFPSVLHRNRCIGDEVRSSPILDAP